MKMAFPTIARDRMVWISTIAEVFNHPQWLGLEQKIRNLLDYTIEEIGLSEKEKSAVIDALDEVKIIDPACGSGAFPMGILQKMLLILQKVDPQSLVWLIKQLDKIPNQAIRKSVEDELMNKNWDYIHKMGLIQNAIYGVDIQPIAVELSKLRFFLTLMVDEDINDKAENRGINPLPNLSFKFVIANSLIGLPQKVEIDLMDRAGIDKKIKELKKVRDDFFFSYGGKKDNLEKRYEQIQNEMFGIYLKSQSTNELALKLIGWKPFTDEKIDWFDSKWMFGVEGGFDIVIGNPPYISYYSRQAKSIKKSMLIYFQQNYDFLKNNRNKKSINTIMLFLEKAVKILSENSIFTYIIDIGFFEKVYKEIRIYLSKYDIIKIITEISAFENVNSGQIIIFGSRFKTNAFSCVTYSDFIKTNIFINREMFINDTLTLCGSNNLFFNKIKYIELNKICKITCGLEYGALRDLFTSNKKFNSKYHPVLNGGKNIPSKYIINYKKEIDGFVLFDKKFEEKLVEDGKNISDSGKVVHLISGNESKYLEEKFFIRQSAFEIIAAYDNDNFYALRSLFVANLINIKYNLKFILSLLNSKLISFFSIQKGIIRFQKGKQPQIRVSGLNKIPIPEILLDNQQPFIKLVDQILSLKKEGKDTQHLEDKIDLKVYKLYELTYDEVKVVDSAFALSKDEYEKFKIE